MDGRGDDGLHAGAARLSDLRRNRVSSRSGTCCRPRFRRRRRRHGSPCSSSSRRRSRRATICTSLRVMYMKPRPANAAPCGGGGWPHALRHRAAAVLIVVLRPVPRCGRAARAARCCAASGGRKPPRRYSAAARPLAHRVRPARTRFALSASNANRRGNLSPVRHPRRRRQGSDRRRGGRHRTRVRNLPEPPRSQRPVAVGRDNRPSGEALRERSSVA